jgi:hypothetical protein
MQQILILHYYKSTIDGVMTSLIDTYFNMRRSRKKENVKMNIICPELYLMGVNEKDDYYNIDLSQTQWHEYINNEGLETKPYEGEYNSLNYHFKCFHNQLTSSIPFLKFNRNFGDFNLLFSIKQDKKKFKSNTIVCSGRLIYEILIGADIELECNKLIVLDSLDTWKSKVGIFSDFDDYFSTLKADITQLSNPANFRETKFRQIEYYHKFSYRRLNAMKQSGLLKDNYTFKRSGKEKTNIGEGLHFENMGKGIFEHLWFGKEVEYKTDGMFIEDGLYYYMKLFELDAFQNQTIMLNKGEIMDKLFMKNIDYLYRNIV